MFPTAETPTVAAVLHTLVAADDDLRSSSTAPDGHRQCIHRQFARQAGFNRPLNGPARTEVDQHGQFQPTFGGVPDGAKASFRGHITSCGFFLRSERGFHTPFLAVDLGQLKEQVQLQADAVLLAPKTVALSALTAECSAKQAKSVVDRSTPHSAADARLSVHSRASISGPASLS